ncbi:alpha/beta hydrolase family protein [Kribbella orskensis]|uniref:Alpha/beta hydrolase family protein n=1 Tax=Kribbella orskensis TaxID=2512216 RepID=A0ABY2BU06_9ACTN|nr:MULTISPECIES: alpha/beta hydrolase [Kribbella]TCN44566.1 alpha/beta hydrolase family protein [Kribbella sp. VKM Ac-2500]TCO31656.1 alpha/beta hydrolase family protein [Kribbella orskensis]
MVAKKSTNGRSLIRAFRILEKIAPGVGAELLDRAWFRFPPISEKARRLRVELPAAEPFEVPFQGGMLRGQAWGEGPTVYLVHGWGGWGLQLAAYIPPLVAEGFRVVTYDGPSHGASDAGRDGPTRSSLPELAEAFQAVVAAQGPAYGVVAHSLGAAATALALRSGFAPRRVVFLAAATDFVHTLDMFQTAFGFGPRVRASFLRRFTRKFGTMESYRMDLVIDALAEERELPALLAIHDRADHETPYQGTLAAAKVWPGATVQLTDGLGHHRVLWDKEVVESTRRFLAAGHPYARAGHGPQVSGERAAADGAFAVRETMQG